MASKFIGVLIIGGIVIIFGISVFPPVHSALGDINTSGLSYVNASWVTLQPYLLLACLGYALWVFTHRR